MTQAGDQSGKLVGIGVGPGDPELLTLKAMHALKTADLIVHFAKGGNPGRARSIVNGFLAPHIAELELRYPVTTEVPKNTPAYSRVLRDFYDESARAIAQHLDSGRQVAVICEGDPLFYGSYMHLHVRLAARYRTDVIAGVTGMSGCWSAAGEPIAQGDDVLTIIPATVGESELDRRLADSDAIVIMKLGRNLPKVRRALQRSGRLPRAVYVERGTMPDTVIMPLLEKNDDHAPYWALVLVPGWEGRP